jgi:acylphosphatase
LENAMTDQRKAVHVRITGRVQGVGFRDWTRGEAIALGLTGWVRNEPDGSVHALLVGAESAVEAMLKRLWKGPRFGEVSDVRSEPATADDAPVDFHIARSR